MSIDKETRAVCNSTLLSKNEEGNYIKLSNISHDESILYELLLDISGIDALFKSVENFKEEHLSYTLLFTKGNETYQEHLGIDNTFKDKYIVALMSYFSHIVQKWDVTEETTIVAEDFKKLALPMYYISDENTSIAINQEIKERYITEIGKKKLVLIIDLLTQFIKNNTEVCNEQSPYEYRPSTREKYKSLCLLKNCYGNIGCKAFSE